VVRDERRNLRRLEKDNEHPGPREFNNIVNCEQETKGRETVAMVLK